jgi:hypothetical protein
MNERLAQDDFRPLTDRRLDGVLPSHDQRDIHSMQRSTESLSSVLTLPEPGWSFVLITPEK